MTPLLISCIKIFFCRIMDVSLGTVRTILTVRGKTFLAAVIGFAEVFLWYIVVKDALSATGPVLPIAVAYAGGYATGTFIGGKLADALIKGSVVVQVITSTRDDSVLSRIREAGYAISVVDVKSSEYSGEKYMLLCHVDTALLKSFEQLVKELDPAAFIFLQESKGSIGGYTARKK
jgi:uncharacterized protein YebE (UPF0316 family)